MAAQLSALADPDAAAALRPGRRSPRWGPPALGPWMRRRRRALPWCGATIQRRRRADVYDSVPLDGVFVRVTAPPQTAWAASRSAGRHSPRDTEIRPIQIRSPIPAGIAPMTSAPVDDSGRIRVMGRSDDDQHRRTDGDASMVEAVLADHPAVADVAVFRVVRRPARRVQVVAALVLTLRDRWRRRSTSSKPL